MSEQPPKLEHELTEAEARAMIVPAETASGNENGTPWTFGDLYDQLTMCGEIKAGISVAKFVELFLAGRHKEY